MEFSLLLNRAFLLIEVRSQDILPLAIPHRFGRPLRVGRVGLFRIVAHGYNSCRELAGKKDYHEILEPATTLCLVVGGGRWRSDEAFGFIPDLVTFLPPAPKVV